MTRETERAEALRALWAAHERNPLKARKNGVRLHTLTAMREEGLVRVVNGGFVLTQAGHEAAVAARRALAADEGR